MGTVNIIEDDVCEHRNQENFFANLAYVSGIQNISIVQDGTQVLIIDSSEPECGEPNAFQPEVIFYYRRQIYA